MQQTANGKGISWSRLKKRLAGFPSRQTMLTMKLTVVLLFAAFLSVSARSTAQTVTLNEKKMSLEKALLSIQEQSGYNIFYKVDIVRKKGRPVDMQLNKASVADALKQVFQNQELTYEITGSTILVKEKEDRKASVVFTPEKNNGTITAVQALIDARGRVVDSLGQPLFGASVKVRGGRLGTTTDANGYFLLKGIADDAMLEISFTGYAMKVVKATDENGLSIVALRPVTNMLGDITLVNTGYQQLKPNEVTGSVVTITRQQLDQRVATDIISKLEGITNGLVFNKNPFTGANQLRIRGESTLFANPNPLIVVDNFPYDGDISSINPNDVENVTVLKDAAAASIWGVQAGNGVIVITTRKGRQSQPLKVELNSNVTITGKPDLFYNRQISSSDYIDLERFLFSNGHYTAALTNPALPAVSPVVEILNKRQLGLITAQQAESQINAYRTGDIRNELLNHVYHNQVNQQYQLNLSGGGNKIGYYFSTGFDRISSNLNNTSNRLTINSQTSFYISRALELKTGIYLAATNSINNNSAGFSTVYPYTRFFDDQGAAISIPKHRADFEDTISKYGFPDWKYYPLQENTFVDRRTNLFDTRLFGALNYKILNGLSVEASYQFQKLATNSKNLTKEQSYAVRNLINTYAIRDNNGNYIGSNFPKGGILNQANNNLTSNSLRAVLNYNRSFSIHAVNALAGIEVREIKTDGNTNTFYGYNDKTGAFVVPNTTVTYPQFPSGNNVNPFSDPLLGMSVTGTLNRFRSYFGNLSYTYNNKYTISGSARFDGTNYFGVNTNNKIVPLWSTGVKWDVTKERFYNIALLPVLNLRATYGFNGNLAPDLAAIVTLKQSGIDAYTGLPYSTINNIPNPDLRWEKMRHFNIGVDFGFSGNRVNGSIEYFLKKGDDLIGDAILDPTSGVNQTRGNFSGMKGKGIDLQLNWRITDGKVKWHSSFIFNYISEQVTRYDVPNPPSSYLTSYSAVTPLVGQPLYSLYSFRWAGLDPQTGDPRVYLADTISKNYSGWIPRLQDYVFNGRYNPSVVGSVQNSFRWKGFDLTFNIQYKLGHYFRRRSVNYSVLLQNVTGDWKNMGTGDIAYRWQKAGDELNTDVPSLVYNLGTQRDLFYVNSDALVEKADHIRLQFVSLKYDFVFKDKPVKGLQLFFYMNNVGIIWKATKSDIDPEYPYVEYPPQRSYSIGLKANF